MTKRTPLRLRLVRLIRLGVLQSLHFLLFGYTIKTRRLCPQRIAVIRFSAVGDFIICVPSLIKLRRSFPEARIMLITAASSQAAIRKSTSLYNNTQLASPWVNFVHPSQVDEVIWIGSFALREVLGECRQRVKKFDPQLAFILPQQDGGSVRSIGAKMVFLRLLGVTSRVVGWKSGMGPLFNRFLFENGLLEHAVLAPLKAVNEVLPQKQSDGVEFILDLPKENSAWAQELKRKHGWDGKQIIAISPGAVQPHKKWPNDHFMGLCKELFLQTNAVLVIIGTQETKELADKMIEGMGGRAINLCGETTIQKLAAWLKVCSLLVGNDGGAMHVAAAVGCRCVAIMPGIEYPGSIEPWGNREWSIRHEIECAPCYSFTNCPLGHNRCITQITISDVLTKCLAAMAPQPSLAASAEP